VANRSEHEHRTPEGSGARGRGVPAGRALVVLVLFVLIALLALSQIHTGSSKAASQTTSQTGSGSGSTATTTPTTPTTTPKSGHHTTTTTTTIPPNTVHVTVFNASEVNGVAKDVSNELHSAGWNVGAPTNASETVTASHVYYVAGYRAPAEAIATSLQIPASAVSPYSAAAPITSMGTADVAVIVGPDVAARVSAAKTSTTTTAASTAG
jgi:LytR cell envelope-related transcriptional attenuator